MGESPGSFESAVLDNMITNTSVRPPWAAHIIAAIKHADAWGRVTDGGLTPEELGILHCLRLRVEGRADRPAEDHLEYAGTTGLLGWALRIFLDDSRVAERQPDYYAVVSQFRRTLDDFLHKAAGAGPEQEA